VHENMNEPYPPGPGQETESYQPGSGAMKI